jgi:hypothetical protein
MAQGSGLFESIRALDRNHTIYEESGLENGATYQPQYHAEHAAKVRLAIGGNERLISDASGS